MSDKENSDCDANMIIGNNGNIKSTFTRFGPERVDENEASNNMSAMVDNAQAVTSQGRISYLGWGLAFGLGALLWVAFFFWLGIF